MFPREQFESRNPIREYVFAIAIVHIIAVIWILFNEVVMSVSDVAFDFVGTTGTPADIVNWLITIYRIIPIMMIIAVWVWAFMRAFRKEAFEQFGGF